MAIALNDLKLTTAASTVLRKLPAANTEVLAAAERTAAINQDLISVLRPDLLGRADLLADASNAETAKAAAILAAVDAGLLGKLRPDLLDSVLRPEQSQAAATLAGGIPRVSPGELITAERINAIIDRLNALGGNAGVTLGGDVTGAAGANRVVALQGRGVATTAPAQGQVLGFANGVWQPTTPAAASVQPVAMRLVAAGLVFAVSAPGVSQVSYQVSSSHGNLRGSGSQASFGLIFDGYDSRNTYVVHTSQRQVAEGRGSERPQFIIRIDPAPDPRFTQSGLGFKVFGAAPNNPPQPVLQEQALAGDLFVEIYQPPLSFTALPLVTDFNFAAIGTVEAGRAENPPKTVESAPAPSFATAELLADPVVNPVFTATPVAEPVSANPAVAGVATLNTSALGAALAATPGTVSGLKLSAGIADTVLRADTPSTASIARGGVDVGNATAPDKAAATPTTQASRSRKAAAKAAPTPPAKPRKR